MMVMYLKNVVPKKHKSKKKQPFAKVDFEVHRMNIEIPDLQEDMEEDQNISTDKMKNVSRLIKDIDSLKADNIRIVTSFSKNITSRMGFFYTCAAY